LMANPRASSLRTASEELPSLPAARESVADICNAAADLNVQALNTALAAAKLSEDPSAQPQTDAGDEASDVCAA
jgi:hypothetical protein